MTQTALITGASRGLGLALAERLAARGVRLVVDARGQADLAAAAARLRQHTEVVAVAGDVTDPEHRAALAAAVGTRLDLLVLNASTLGTSPLPPLADYDLDGLRRTVEVNTIAPLGLVQLLLPAVRRAGGVVIAVSSDAAVEGYEGWGGYGASKAALDQLARVLAAEEPTIRVYAVDPGDMRTAMHAEADPDADPADLADPVDVAASLDPLLAGGPPSGRYTAAGLTPTVGAV